MDHNENDCTDVSVTMITPISSDMDGTKDSCRRRSLRNQFHRIGRRKQNHFCCNITTTISSPLIQYGFMVCALFLLIDAVTQFQPVMGQFNEPPGQRREQTYRVLDFEVSNINQHYPGDLRYYCTFRGKWSEERHPNQFPNSPSWSGPVIISHTKSYRMWTGTETVTAGVEYYAEEGYPTLLYQEFDNAGFETLQMVVGERMFNTTESQILPPINVTYTHPWLSSMVKVTPSPDWFVGFSDLRMISYDTETYYNRIVIQSYVWDSGTDDGQSYLAFDRDLDPQAPCTRFCVPANLGAGGAGTSDTNINHHANGNSKSCPDKEKGRKEIPLATLPFVDYTLTYIPYPAEFECVLRVGDGEVYAGTPFNESQIRPPMYVARPDDDFLDGISPYDQPRYDEYVDSLEDVIPVEEEWNKNWLWLIFLIILLISTCCCFTVYLCLMYLKQKPEKKQPPPRGLGYDPDSEYDGPNLFYNQQNEDDYDGDLGIDYDEDGNPIDIMQEEQHEPFRDEINLEDRIKGVGNESGDEDEFVGDGTQGYTDFLDDDNNTNSYNDDTNTNNNNYSIDDSNDYDDESEPTGMYGDSTTATSAAGDTASGVGYDTDDADYDDYLESQQQDESTGFREIL